jgi:hypothetical protein
MDTASIQVFFQVSGVPTQSLLTECLYTINEPDEIREIVAVLDPVEQFVATQRKAKNWLVFRRRDGAQCTADLDQDACELRLTCDGSIREFKIGDEACRRLALHLEQARRVYEDAYDK